MAADNEATLLVRIKQAGGEILDRFVITLGDVINIVGEVADALYSTIEAYREEELAVNELTNSMINQGVFTGELRNKYLDMASALQQVTTFGDEQIINAQAILQGHVKNKEVTQELVQATLDLAAAKKMDLASAADLVGKAIASDNDILARHGIHVREAANENEKLANVIAAVEGKFAGRAQAMAKDLGVLDQLKNAWSDFLERIGGLLAPLVTAFGQAALAAVNFLNAVMPKRFDASKASVSDLNQEILKLRREIIAIQERAEQRGTPLDAWEQAMVKKLESSITEYKSAQAEMLAVQKESADKQVQIEAEKNEKLRQQMMDEEIFRQDQMIASAEQAQMDWEKSLANEMAALDKRLQMAQTYHEKKNLIRQRAVLAEELADAKAKSAEAKRQEEHDKEMAQNRDKFLGHMASLQNSHNSVMATIGKAAAIAQITINTAEAAMAGYKWGMAIGGPPLAAVFSGLAIAAGAAQTARVAGVQLAEGGVVRATPGGVPAIIGEGGRDEAVIPLEDGLPAGGMMGGVTVHFHGPILGNEDQADAFARQLDRAFLRLRQRNESVAFDSDVF